MDFALNLMNFVLKMMNLVYIMMAFATCHMQQRSHRDLGAACCVLQYINTLNTLNGNVFLQYFLDNGEMMEHCP